MSSGARLLTPYGPGGVAVIEVRGARALERLAALAGGVHGAPGVVRLVRLRALSHAGVPSSPGAEGAHDLDEALLVGRDPDQAGTPRAELHLHGSPPLVDEVLELLAGAEDDAALDAERPARAPWRVRLARRAEDALVRVPTELGARALVDQAEGALARALDVWAGLSPQDARAALGALAARSAAAAALFEPPRVVLVGPVNAGKSTLFNLLAGEERALVSPEAGTTRDALGADVALGPYVVRLVDTAGERPLGPGPYGAAQDAVTGRETLGDGAAIERAGQAVARALAGSADVVLALARAGTPGASAGLDDAGTVHLATAAELAHGALTAAWPAHTLSAEEAPDHARAVVEAAVLAALAARGLSAAPVHAPCTPVLWAVDQRDALARALAAVGGGVPVGDALEALGEALAGA